MNSKLKRFFNVPIKINCLLKEEQIFLALVKVSFKVFK